MAEAIPIQYNTTYSPALINQKYNPLNINGLAVDMGVQDKYKELFTNRMAELAKDRLFPSPLKFYADDWAQIRQNEREGDLSPPIVVVSSNRSKWIKATTERAKQIQQPKYKDVNDTKATCAGPTPWYCPKRLNEPNKNVYIFVHWMEYDAYKSALTGTRYNVIGWSFDPIYDIKQYVPYSFTGFGPARYAAIEFCKYIFNHPVIDGVERQARSNTKQKAWLVDDNVVYINSFPGFGNVENHMPEGCYGIGFNGATKNTSDLEITKVTKKAPAAVETANFESTGILQQCVLWNIYELYNNSLNFSPIFINSHEDTSFSYYLQKQLGGSRLRIIKGTGIIKGIPSHDEGPAGENIQYVKKYLTRNFYVLEEGIRVKEINKTVDESLMTSIESFRRSSNIQWEEEPSTACKAVEQIMERCCAESLNWVPANVFKRAGLAQVIQIPDGIVVG